MAFSALVADKYAPANTHAGAGVYLGPDVCNNSGSLAMFAAIRRGVMTAIWSLSGGKRI
jgi:hypothetical protein